MVQFAESIRFRAYVYIGFFVMLIGVLAWQVVSNFEITSRNLEQLQEVQANRAEAAMLRFQVVELQNYVKVFQELENEAVATRLEALYMEVRNYLLENSSSRPAQDADLLRRTLEHLDSYYRSFELMAADISRRSSLVDEQLMPAYLEQDALINLVPKTEDRNYVLVQAGVLDAVALLRSARAKVITFLLYSNFEQVSQARLELNQTVTLIRNARDNPVLGDQLREDLLLLEQSVESMDQTLIDVISSTRGYLFLANVSMGGDANEIANLANELVNLADEQVDILYEAVYTQANDLQNWAVLEIMVVAFLTFLFAIGIERYFLKPMSGLTDVFQRLVKGYPVEKILGTGRRDEFGALANAADVFREKSRETEAVLMESSRLVAELKSKNTQLGREIHERKRIEDQMQRQSNDLARSNEDLAQFAHVASHDLQEPLRMISSYLQLINQRYRDKLDADGIEFIDFAVQGAHRTQALIRSLLEYSRIGDNQKSEWESIDCNNLLQMALKNLEVNIEETGAIVTVGALPEIEGDTSQLVSLFQNLLGNAIRYHGESPPEIRVDCEINEDEYLFSVSDKGVGFSEEYAERIFVIFQRLHGREEYPDSTGIGLSVCKRIVEWHGGRIWVTSEMGVGSTFFFTLPRKKQDDFGVK